MLHASVFPRESVRTAAAVSPYKDVCLWKDGWNKKKKRGGTTIVRKKLIDGRTGGKRRIAGASRKERMRGGTGIKRKRRT